MVTVLASLVAILVFTYKMKQLCDQSKQQAIKNDNVEMSPIRARYDELRENREKREEDRLKRWTLTKDRKVNETDHNEELGDFDTDDGRQFSFSKVKGKFDTNREPKKTKREKGLAKQAKSHR